MRKREHIRMKIPVLAIAALLLWSCGEEPIEWELQTGQSDLLVVEGVITNERKAHEVKSPGLSQILRIPPNR